MSDSLKKKRNVMVPGMVFSKLLKEVGEAERPVYNNPVQPFEQYQKALEVEFEAISVRLFDRLRRACETIKAEASH
jgi:hypothetical protein